MLSIVGTNNLCVLASSGFGRSKFQHLRVVTPPFKWSSIHVATLLRMHLVSCPAPPCTCEKEGLVFWATFLVTAPQSESSNQIAERIIICNDVHCRQSSMRSSMHGECNNYFFHAVQPRPMWQEMLLRTPDPLSTFRGRGLGTRLVCTMGVIINRMHRDQGRIIWAAGYLRTRFHCSCEYSGIEA